MKTSAFIRYVLYITFLVPALLTAQKAVQVKKLNTDEGLNFRHVNVVTQDPDGFMWFGTPQGITKYDDNTFKVFDSGKNNPNFIPYEIILKFQYQESTNTLWYIASHKLFALNLDSEKLVVFDEIEQNLKGEVLELTLDKKDHLWIVTDVTDSNKISTQKLIKFDGKQLKLIKSLERNSTGFTSLEVNSKNNQICWSTIDNGLLFFDEEGHFIQSKILDTYNWYGNIIHFGESFFDSQGRHFYFPKSSGGVDLYSDLVFSLSIIKRDEIIYHAREDANNGIWFAGNKELLYLDETGQIFNYTKNINDALNFTHINGIFVDATDLLWLGTNNGLLKVKLKNQNFQGILKTDENEWGLTFRNIFHLKDGTIAAMCESESNLYNIDSVGNATVMKFKNAKSKLHGASFFASDTLRNKAFTVTNALVEIDFKTRKITSFNEFSTFLDSSKPTPIIQLKNSGLLIGSKLSKLIIINPDNKTFEPVFENPFKYDDYEFNTFKQSKTDPKIVWIGTQSHGLLKVNLKGFIEKNYTINSTPALNKNAITSLLENETQLFIGTYGGGINILDLKNDAISIKNKETGLSNNNVVSILSADKNKIIAATYNGLSTFNLKTKVHLNYYVEDGLTHNEFNYTSAYKDKNGYFYFGGMNGINKFKYEELAEEHSLPALNFTQFEAYNQKKETLIRISKMPNKPIILTPYDINFKIEWSIPDYFDKDNFKFYTMLEGLENRWFYQDNLNSIRYNKLPAGKYKLRIRGADINGNTSKAELQIPILIKEIFHKQWWFKSLVVIFIMSLFYAFFRYRLNQGLAIEKLRTKISSDLHDDVGSMLAGLAMQTEMLEMQTNHEIDKNKLHKITLLSRNTISHMRDLVWSIDARRDTIADLFERMQELAEELLLPANITYTIEVDELKLNKKINLNCKRNLFLIYKEAIINIIKHSTADKVSIKITNKNGECIFDIKDNGHVGNFECGTGMGLANMELRCKSINAKLKFDFKNGFGVKVHLPHSV